MGKAFNHAHRMLDQEITDALDAFDCHGYSIKTVSASHLKDADFAACLLILKTGEAVDLRSARSELPQCTQLAIALQHEMIVGIAAIKRHRPDYNAKIATRSGVDLASETLELGYVAVMPEHRGNGLSHCLVKALMGGYPESLFATTATVPMKRTLTNCGFENKGKEWQGRNDQMLSFWEHASSEDRA
jgi:GNAT superfamily N-acetyltransferase